MAHGLQRRAFRRGWILVVLVTSVTAGCRRSEAAVATTVSLPTGATVAAAPSGDAWPMATGDAAQTRFSALADIAAANAATLAPLWHVELPGGAARTSPVAEHGVVFVASRPHTITAYGDGGRLRWQYTAEDSGGCCRGDGPALALAGGRLLAVLPGSVAALDAGTGRGLWHATPAPPGDRLAAGPLLVGDRVIVGNGGAAGTRGWIAGLDAGTGRTVWRAWSTGSDADALVGADFDPFYASDRGPDLGIGTWLPEAWHGGGGVPGAIAWDPRHDLLYYGTGAPEPPAEPRSGDRKWTSGVFARDPGHGEARWFYQMSPDDRFRHGGDGSLLLLDLPIDGAVRPAIVAPGRNGLMYVIDRLTGEVLAADPFGTVTTTQGVDPETGHPLPGAASDPRSGRVARLVCPAAGGATDAPAAFSAQTGLVYVAHHHTCMDVEPGAGASLMGGIVRRYAGPGGHRGAVTAWDPVTRRVAWQAREAAAVSGVLTTAGGIVVYGTADGWLRVLDAAHGGVVWQQRLGAPVVAPPMTYRDGARRQVIVVVTGAAAPFAPGRLHAFALSR